MGYLAGKAIERFLDRPTITIFQPRATPRNGGTVSQPAGSSGLVDTGHGRGPGTGTGTGAGGGGGTGTGSGGGSGNCSNACVIIPPAPPIDQNPNNGPNPAAAPARDKPEADWDRTVGFWDLSKGWDAIFEMADMLGLIDDEEYTPEELRDRLLDPYLDEARNPRGDSRNADRRDDQSGNNATGMITPPDY
ncbi:hypothetical protein J2X68_007470 [Streptomyces sp. 3330]|uniref:hypothetical protein n=1 Tax=Streptomyces sp. 3330 TaxID=2817755 RepID=UPI00285F931A|nr:hypothetical protein [Streptomyces sp. 3330]MDR6980728.1 hypothetical protein [Streptomyces sp. 3330]